VLTPNILREGESGQEDEQNLNKAEEMRDYNRKRKLEDEPSKPWKTRGIRKDYRKLHDPYESEEEKSQEYGMTGNDTHNISSCPIAKMESTSDRRQRSIPKWYIGRTCIHAAA